MTENIPLNGQQSTSQVPEDVNRSQLVDSDSRVELLERNLRYIQQQHEVILADLHQEINRLQQENKNLQYRLINIDPSEQQQQEYIQESIPKRRSLDDREENQMRLEARIAELEKELLDSDENNKYLLSKITELNRLLASKSETHDNPTSTPTDDSEYQNIISALHEKQAQYVQEMTKLRTVTLEILNTERLSIASKILLRDCLTSTNINELATNKTTTTPIDMLFHDEKQTHRSNASPSLLGRTSSLRLELPLRRLNISPPQIPLQRLNNQHRVNLPNISQRNGSSFSQRKDSADANAGRDNSMSPSDYVQYQRLTKVGQTPIARRERRTQELQRNRLMKNLYH